MSAFTQLTLTQIASALQYVRGRLGSTQGDSLPPVTFEYEKVIGVNSSGVMTDMYGVSSSIPQANTGSGSSGTSTDLSRSDHTHPTDTSRAPVANPTFTGVVTIPSVPTTNASAASKAYVDSLHQIYHNQAVDVTVANTVAETSLFNTPGSIPANTLAVGDILCFEAYGKMSTLNSAQTAQVKLKFGSSDLLGSSQLTLSTTTLTNDLFVNRLIVRVKQIGTSGVVQCFGYTMIHDGTGISQPVMREVIGSDVAVNTTTAISVDETYQWGTANAANTITMSVALFRKMN